MQYRNLGNTGVQLSAMGLGCMGMRHAYSGRDDEKSLITLERSIELGVNFWDTADFYGNGENERLVAKVLVPRRDKVFIATKFGLRATTVGAADLAAIDALLTRFPDIGPRYAENLAKLVGK